MVCAAEDELDVGGELMLWVYGLVIACSDVWRHLVQKEHANHMHLNNGLIVSVICIRPLAPLRWGVVDSAIQSQVIFVVALFMLMLSRGCRDSVGLVYRVLAQIPEGGMSLHAYVAIAAHDLRPAHGPATNKLYRLGGPHPAMVTLRDSSDCTRVL